MLPVSYTILYNNRNITADVAPYLISLTYTDKTEKEADELELQLEDRQGLWRNEWYPDKGATLTAQIIQGGHVLNCGTFVLDQFQLTGSKDGGDTVSLKGLSTGFNKALRTKNSRAHENITLRGLATTVAASSGLTVVGSIPAITLERVTQYQEHDVAFLQRIAHSYGLVFSIRDKQLIFTSLFDLEKVGAVLTFSKSELGSYDINDKSFETYAKAVCQYHDPKSKKKIKGEDSTLSDATNSPAADTLILRGRVENEQQARYKAKTALYRANGLQQGGSISYPGSVLAVAGNNINLEGLGKLSGKYHLTQSTHSIAKDGGYTGSGEVKRLALIAAEKARENEGSKKKKEDGLSDIPGYVG